MSKNVIVIPARMNSTRLPGKMLLRETGKPLIQHTYDSAIQSRKADGVYVATNTPEIINALGPITLKTGNRPRCGMERVAEAVGCLQTNYNIVVNLQGDEPEVTGEMIDLLIGLLECNPKGVMATLVTDLTFDQCDDTSCVKAWVENGVAVGFFRSGELPGNTFRHIGILDAYRPKFLMMLAQMPQSKSESIYDLEQLRALNNGYKIITAVVDHPYRSINTAEDYKAFVERQERLATTRIG